VGLPGLLLGSRPTEVVVLRDKDGWTLATSRFLLLVKFRVDGSAADVRGLEDGLCSASAFLRGWTFPSAAARDSFLCGRLAVVVFLIASLLFKVSSEDASLVDSSRKVDVGRLYSRRE